MKAAVKLASLVFLVCFAVVACTTTGQKEEVVARPPEIRNAMPLDQALQAGIDFGGETLEQVKRLVKRRQEGDKAGMLLRTALHQNMLKYQAHQLFNATHLFIFSPQPLDVPLFKAMLASGEPLLSQLGWQIAASKASPQIAAAIDAELTRAVRESDEESVLLPQTANAVVGNRLKGSYTLMRQGLFLKGNEEFARAMIVLDPRRAAIDFIPYLAQAPAEELRQLTLSSINLYTAMIALEHVRRAQPSAGVPHFDHLFFYAVSRNNVLSELSQSILESYVPQETEALAQMLARHPVWVQVAYLENVRRRMTPAMGVLLTELKKTSAEYGVIQEIESIKF